MLNIPCGCDERKQIIGESQFWNSAILVGSIALLGLAKGGAVSNETKKIVGIAATGAVVAIVIDYLLKPGIGIK